MNDNWEVKKLIDVCNIQYGYAFDSSCFCDDNSYPQLIRIRDVVRGYSETFYKGYIPEGYYINKGDYLIGMDGEFHIAPWQSEKALLNQRVCKISASDCNVDERFIFYKMSVVLKQIEDETPFVTVKHLSAKRLNLVKLPIPPLPEQSRIVEELDLLSNIIEKKRQQLSELDNLAQSIFYDMFGDIYGNKYGFEIKELNEVFEFIKDGTHQTPQYVDENNGVKFLSAKDVVKGFIDWSNIKYISQELHLQLSKRVSPMRNDILLCKNGTYGICALVETDEIFDIYVSLALMRPKKEYLPKYLVYAINNPITKEQFNKSIKGVGVPNLHLGEIKKTRIIIPPLSLQQLFAQKIEAIEKQKALIKQSIAETEELFNSRMDYYFS